MKRVEGSTPTGAGAPDHPNLIGMNRVADFALEALKTARRTNLA